MDIANHFPVNENTVCIYCSTMLLLPEIKEALLQHIILAGRTAMMPLA
jgi:hypothetical protein